VTGVQTCALPICSSSFHDTGFSSDLKAVRDAKG
jgi:hypothetical protein